MPTIRQALNDAVSQLADSSTPHLDARWLLEHVTGRAPAALIAHDDVLLTAHEIETYAALVTRRAQGEPVAYLVGEAGFYGRSFYVSPAVLIPRPETEHLIEAALEAARAQPAPRIADIGTGSGIIAVTLAAELSGVPVVATDTSAEALEIAARNAARHGAAVAFRQGHLAAPLLPDLAGTITVLCANLPYIPAAEVPRLAVSRYEPTLALAGGPDGLDLIRELLAQVPQVCAPGAVVLLEIGYDQGEALTTLAHSVPGVTAADILRDYAGRDRVARLRINRIA